jgi:cobalt-zinc-cadmium efflux system membrane fusion protein
LTRGGIAAALAAFLIIGAALSPRWTRYFAPRAQAAAQTDPPAPTLAGTDGIDVPADVVARLGVAISPALAATAPVTLEMSGTLMFDSGRLSHVRARFPGEIVQLGPASGQAAAVGFGRKVHKNQLLAVIWSQDLGEKKCELIDALSQLRVDEDSLQRIKSVTADGSIPERLLHDAERKVEADRIVVSRAERTLQTWRISAEEIEQVRAEANRLLREKKPDREELVTQWARLEVRAPLDGTIVECNVVLGDLVDASTDLFRIADLSRLRVLAHAYEEDLPSLDAVKDHHGAWSVALGTGPGAAVRGGEFDQVGCIIDPNQHTAMVMGWVDNPGGELRVGQFVTVRMEIPPPLGEVAIPASALCEDSDRTSVFVQAGGKATYVRRNVAVTRRRGEKVYIRSQPTSDETRRGLQPLAPGEQVVVSRTVELAACLDTLRQNAGTP